MAKRKRIVDTYEEGTDAYERTHVDLTALNEVFEVIKRIRRGKGFVGPQYDWFDSVCPSYNVRLSYNPTQTIVDESLREKAVKARDVLKPAADALYKIWGHVSRQLEICENNIEAYDLRRGFFCLPDELLSSVLEYAALQEARRACRDAREDGESDGEVLKKKFIVWTVKSAVKLSHVCKRFRELIICSPCLWNQVFSEMGKEGMVSACLERCRRGNAEVTVSSPLFGSRMDWFSIHRSSLFLDAALKKTESWGSFTIKGDDRRHSRFESVDLTRLKDYAELAKVDDFPNLKHLSISYPPAAVRSSVRTDAKFHNPMHFYSSWSTPRLQSIFANNLVPVSFSGSRSLTSLHIALDFDGYSDANDRSLDIKSFVSFLSACPDLKKFALDLTDSKHFSSPPASEARLLIPGVTDLALSFHDCCSSPVKCLFDHIGFPKVSKMQLDIRSTEGDKKEDLHFRDTFNAVIPHADAFPHLIDMNLVMNARGFWDEDARVYQRHVVTVPFALMPNVRYLTLKTLSSEMEFVTDGVVLPAIRELRLRACYGMKTDWVSGFLRQMEAQEHLGSLRVFVDGDSEVLNQCDLRGWLTKEDIRKLIKSDGDN